LALNADRTGKNIFGILVCFVLCKYYFAFCQSSFVTESFVCLHLPRTRGSWSADCCYRCNNLKSACVVITASQAKIAMFGVFIKVETN